MTTQHDATLPDAGTDHFVGVTDMLAAFDALIAAHDTASAARRAAIRECSREIDAALDRLRKLA